LVPALNGTKEILKAVKAHAPSVMRVVITGSCAAIVDFTGEAAKPATAEPRTYTEDDRNPDSWETAMAGTLNVAYCASKKFAEQAAWDFLEVEKPIFDIVVLNPPMVYGPIRHSVPSLKDLNESIAMIYNLFVDAEADGELPPNGMPSYVDVRDLADAHWLAATTRGASNTRMIICGGRASSQNISDALRKNVPELRTKTPKGVPGGNPLSKNAYYCSSEKAQKVLGLRFRSMEETFVDLARQLVELESKSAA
jgi:nucleoside-diphosphate-sugar epimerase